MPKIFLIFIIAWILIGIYCGIRNAKSYLKIKPKDDQLSDYSIPTSMFIMIGILAGPIGLFVKY